MTLAGVTNIYKYLCLVSWKVAITKTVKEQKRSEVIVILTGARGEKG